MATIWQRLCTTATALRWNFYTRFSPFNDWAPRSRKREVSRRFAPWNWTSLLTVSISCIFRLLVEAEERCALRVRDSAGEKCFYSSFQKCQLSRGAATRIRNCVRSRASERETRVYSSIATEKIRSIKSIRGSRRESYRAGKTRRIERHASPPPQSSLPEQRLTSI